MRKLRLIRPWRLRAVRLRIDAVHNPGRPVAPGAPSAPHMEAEMVSVRFAGRFTGRQMVCFMHHLPASQAAPRGGTFEVQNPR